MRDLSLHLMDIVQNSIVAQADRVSVNVTVDIERDILVICVVDNGTGMDSDLLCRVSDPFVTTRNTRMIGLGIPLFKASAERTGGSLVIDSMKGNGTIVKTSFRLGHIDRPPLGDIAETVVNLIAADSSIAYELLLKAEDKEFSFTSQEVKERLGEVPIIQYEVLSWIKEFINDGITTTFGGVLNEIDS